MDVLKGIAIILSVCLVGCIAGYLLYLQKRRHCVRQYQAFYRLLRQEDYSQALCMLRAGNAAPLTEQLLMMKQKIQQLFRQLDTAPHLQAVFSAQLKQSRQTPVTALVIYLRLIADQAAADLAPRIAPCLRLAEEIEAFVLQKIVEYTKKQQI